MRYRPGMRAAAFRTEGKVAQHRHEGHSDGPPAWHWRPHGYKQPSQTSTGGVYMVKPNLNTKQQTEEL